MKLIKVHITNFQSIQDSTEFDIGDVTCLVGKNEAGKTALLKALYRLNPILEEDGDFDSTEDYPRRAVSDYEDDVESGRRDPARAVKATYELEPEDIDAVEEVFGPQCLIGECPTVTLTKGYANKRSFSDLRVDSKETLKHLVNAADLPLTLTEQLCILNTADEMVQILHEEDQTEAIQGLLEMLEQVSEHDVGYVVYSSVLRHRIPKFLYFDEYYQMRGQDNVDALKQRIDENTLEGSDHPLLGLLELARLDIDQVADPREN